MATVASMVSGNFTAAATWRTILSEVDSEIAVYSSIGSAGYTNSTGFAAAGQSCCGIALKLASSTTTMAGVTFTAELYNSTDGTITQAFTVNKIDMVCETALTTTPTWVFFKFTPVTLTSGKTYIVRVKQSTTGSISLYGNGSSISYLMISDTTTTPAAGDKILISGNLTGAGTGNDVEVTMDNTAATSFGGIMLGRRGTLRYSTTPGSIYKLVIGGNAMGASSGTRGIEICNSGLLEIGSALSGMPSSATGQLQLNCGSAVAFGIECRTLGRMTTYGSSKLSYTRLATTASGTATVLQVASNSGWQVGDTIAIAANKRVANQHESRVISSLIGSTGVVITSGLTNVHDGGNNALGYNVGAHIANLTENVQIFGGTISFSTYLNFSATAQISMYNSEIYWIGSATASKRGIDFGNTVGTCIVSNCSIHDNTVTSSSMANLATNSVGININNCVFYNGTIPMIIGATTSFATIDSNCFIGNSTSQVIIQVNDNGSVVTNNVISGGSFGIKINEGVAITGTFSGNIVYNLSSGGFYIPTQTNSGTISNNTIFRNIANGGIYFNAVCGHDSAINIDSCVLFGNTTSNIFMNTGNNLIITNCVLAGETNFATTSGITVSVVVGYTISIINSTFSSHTQDINCASYSAGNISLNNCTLSSSTEIGSQATLSVANTISSHNHDGVVGSYVTFKRFGTIRSDTTVYSTYPPSLKMVPTSASFKLTSEGAKGNPCVYVGTGKSITAIVKVRASVLASGDSATYNGAFPRLLNKANYPILGTSSDTVLATATIASSGSFLTISGTTSAVSATGVLEFYVDCDGTAGFVNVDDWSFYQNN